jgi:hypothetical protein
MNNVLLANAMTYSRHYPFLEEVFEALGRDIARAVAFFREVDATRPGPEDVMRQHGLKSTESVEYLRAFENSVITTAREVMQKWRTVHPSRQPLPAS